ncbi:MAG: photosystem I reaction center subunit XI [Cyanobacteria bacterium P01_A01_bin.135]
MTISEKVNQSSDRPSDPRNQEVVNPAASPMNGNLATPVNASQFSTTLIGNLSAYRDGLSVTRRGLEVGIAHGLIIYTPFAKLGPLRDTGIANVAGLFSSIGLTAILTATLLLYAASNPPAPSKTITTPNPPQALATRQGWQEYAKGFGTGSLIGVAIACTLVSLLGI